jgi:pyruvate kinase
VRAAAERCGREVAVLQDLLGPKIRLGDIDGEVRVAPGARLVITTRDVVGSAKENVVPTDYRELPGNVRPGMLLLIDEGRVSAVVRSVEGQDVVCEVKDGGVLVSNKGLNVPGAALTTSAMTDKDRADVRFGLDLGVDFVALSFVRRSSDIDELRRFMVDHGRVVPIIAKIEKPQAVEAIDEIVATADGVMVARGDLAIEATLEMIPVHQKKIIERANRAGKLVITATQMLESMTYDALPTRAEVTDVANAVLDGTDAVMLSGETAVGKHPVESVKRMASIASTTEEALFPFDEPVRREVPGDAERASRTLPQITARMAAQGARECQARAIAVFTKTGDMAMRLSDERPRAPVVAFTRERQTLRRLALYWGVEASLVESAPSPAELVAHAGGFVLSHAGGAPGDVVVVVLGSKLAPGSDYSVKLLTVGEPL